MSLRLVDNFSYQARKPLDNRLVQKTIADMVALPENGLYTGIMVFCEETNKFYVYNFENEVDTTLGKWGEFKGGNGKFTATVNTNLNSPLYGHLVLTFEDSTTMDCGYVMGDNIATIAEYEAEKFYPKSSILYLGNRFARVLNDYTSGSVSDTVTLEDLFESDVNLIFMSNDVIDDTIIQTEKTYSSSKIESLLKGVSSSFIGTVRSDRPEDLPQSPSVGDWCLIQECEVNFPGQGGIGAYRSIGWEVSAIPNGKFVFPEPLADGKMYFRTVSEGATTGTWSAFTKTDGNDITITVRIVDGSSVYIPEMGELVYVSDTSTLVLGDGVTKAVALRPFYEISLASSDVTSALGFTPENSAQKGQAYGYAPLDSSGKVPPANLPASATSTYSKAEVDTKLKDSLLQATLLVNEEASTARAKEDEIKASLEEHTEDTVIHVTQPEKDTWDAKVDTSALLPYSNHISNDTIHVTQAEKDKWNGMNKVYYVTNKNNLPTTGNSVGNLGYVQTSVSSSGAVVCDTYLWNGNAWVLQDVNQVSLDMKWGNLNDRPTSTPFAIDNAVNIAHTHNNMNILNKIGQSGNGAFTFDGQEIGVRVVFLSNEMLLPETGIADTLYVIYEDSRVRKYPSISVWSDGAFQILGRGTQDSPQVVGDMSILQAEFFSISANSKQKIKVTDNPYFSFMPVEILKEIPGLTNQAKMLANFGVEGDFVYDDNFVTITEAGKLILGVKELQTNIYDVQEQYFSEIEVDLSEYKEIGGIA